MRTTGARSKFGSPPPHLRQQEGRAKYFADRLRHDQRISVVCSATAAGGSAKDER